MKSMYVVSNERAVVKSWVGETSLVILLGGRQKGRYLFQLTRSSQEDDNLTR
jgi:hypothetical protein